MNSGDRLKYLASINKNPGHPLALRMWILCANG